MFKTAFRASAATAVAGCLLLLSAGLNLALGVRVAQQRRTITDQDGVRETQNLLGTVFIPFPATDLNGNSKRIDFAGERPTVLYFFQPGCSWCERNHEAIVALHEQKSDAFRFVGVSLSDIGLSEYLERQPLPFDVVTGLPRDILATYQLGGTPRTMVIGPDGLITGNYFGAYFGSTARSIDREFEVDLPEVAVGGDH